MTWTEMALVTTMQTPEDQADIEQALHDLLFGGLPDYGLDWSLYSATHPTFYAGAEAAFTKGQVELGVFDHVQGCNRVAAQKIGGLITLIGHDPIAIGTSPQAHQIAHQKCICQNVAITAEQLARQQALPDFNDWRLALAAGQAVTWSGSWNVDLQADKQINNVDVIVGWNRSQHFASMVRAHHDWIRTNEPDWQRIARLFVGNPARAALDPARG